MPVPERTDEETLERLLASGKLSLTEAAEIQGMYGGVKAGGELDPAQRLKANALYNRHILGDEAAQTSRRRAQAHRDELMAKFDAMPRPKKPPGK